MSYENLNLTSWGCCRRGSCGPCAPYISASCGRLRGCGPSPCGVGPSPCGVGGCGGCGVIPVGVGTGSCGAAIGTFTPGPWGGGASPCCPGFSCRSRCGNSFASGCCSSFTSGCYGGPNAYW